MDIAKEVEDIIEIYNTEKDVNSVYVNVKPDTTAETLFELRRAFQDKGYYATLTIDNGEAWIHLENT